MEEETRARIKELRHNRGIIKSKLTRFETFLHMPENLDKIPQLQMRLKYCQTDFEEFQKIQSELEFLDKTEIAQREQIETNFYEIMSIAESSIISQDNTENTSVMSQNRNVQFTKSENMHHTKLPDVSLPSFYGNYDTWISFNDIFHSAVHNRKDLSNIQKFIYLKMCCKGDALRIIESLEVTAENYSIALSLLKKRFENKRATVNYHVKTLLFKLPEVKGSSSYNTLRKLVDTVYHHTNALQKFNLPINQWDDLLIPVILKNLDSNLKGEWEDKIGDKLQDDELPTLKQLMEFLTKKCFKLEAMHTDNADNAERSQNKVHRESSKKYNKFENAKGVQQAYSVTERNSCTYCKESHFIFECPEFKGLSLNEKYLQVKKHKLCSNCLRSGHLKFQCKSSHCKICSYKHNTLLHNDKYNDTNERKRHDLLVNRNNASTSATQTTVAKENETNQRSVNSSHEVNNCHVLRTEFEEESVPIFSNTFQVYKTSNDTSQVLLSTATILIEDCHGNNHECTALLDSGSQSNLITQKLCNDLKLSCEKSSISIAGINQKHTNVTQKVSTKIRSRFNTFPTELTFLVLPIITEKLPLVEFDRSFIKHQKNIELADENFNVPKTIDVLLGASIFYELLGIRKLRLGKNMPMLYETRLGWILTGSINIGKLNKSEKSICNFSENVSNERLNESLTKFWQLEELPPKQILSREAQQCEDIFVQTTTRNVEGRFEIRLPFCNNKSKNFGKSKEIALRRFYGIESRFLHNDELKTDYINFMREYEDLHHMSFKSNLEIDNTQYNDSYFLPHHAVIKQSSTTTKCRVVFDASAKSSNKVSLNDLLLVGPVVQEDLFSIVLRLRLRGVVLNADIEKMYRQILVHKEDRKYQQILWRYDKTEPIKSYELNTLTYGTASAPFLATRCLKQLADENDKIYPRSCSIIRNSFYMDDLLVSLDSTEEALKVYRELTEILGTAGFQLRKWSSNEKTILETIKKNNPNDDKLVVVHDKKELKTLGVVWNSNFDTLSYSININNSKTMPSTKRSVLSVICQIFDPLGLIGPATIKAKLLMQRLWQLRIDWDEVIPEELRESWLTFLLQLDCLNSIYIKRKVTCNDVQQIELHCFCDASERAYGACIYVCSINSNGERVCRLLCGKSKVAPIKQVTLPRLELLAAVLLARLTKTVQKTLDMEISKIILYSDSTIVLSWIKIDPSQLKTFVANRVAIIAELTDIENWRHVKGTINPADVISRGINPKDLLELKIWWYGPSFLLDNQSYNDNVHQPISLDRQSIPEIKSIPITLVVNKTLGNLGLFERYSTLNKIQNVVGYICRFKNCTLKKEPVITTSLTTEELHESMIILVKLSQHATFSDEMSDILHSKRLKSNSKISNLNPFIDRQGILRVGGRISNSDVNEEQKHPIILSNNHRLIYLIIAHEHSKHLHLGVQGLLSVIRLKYWPIHGKNVVKSVIRDCIRCSRLKSNPANFLMGELPHDRVNISRPFLKCGVDYAGPILIKDTTLRKYKLIKTYICIFVCFAVRAIHIELVNDLTTDSFLNALKRFISRRGKPSDIFSDNGLNFRGAHNHFVELSNLIADKSHNERVSNHLAHDGIKWHFNPPRAPHTGGLWEAAVKSTKFHLRRILGNALVSYEELYTILTQIEACLNSRPLTPLSIDPNDYLPLTPSHFLIGDSLAATPQRDVHDISVNRRLRYQFMQKLVQQFWRRWSQEYLTQLQQRSKWKTKTGERLQIGTLVVLKEDNLPILQWPMARVTALHPGADGIVRVVSVKVASGSVFKRTLRSICILPVDTTSVND